MSNFLTAKRKAERLTPQRISDELFDLIRKIEDVLAKTNANTLHEHSTDVEGNPIGFYSAGTEAITGGRKRMGQPFDLKESGEFLNSVFARVENHSIFFDATDSKKEEVLYNLLSKDIFGLTDENLRKVIDEKILPSFLKYLKHNLF